MSVRTGLLLLAVWSANVCQAALLKVSTKTLPPATAGAAYSQSLAATGGQTPYSWSVSAGALPAGLSLSAAGSISGTPQANGSFSFTVKVTDAASDSDAQALPITVAASKPTITTTALAAATAGSAYSASLAASAAVAPLSWSVSQGSLPSGLTLAASTGVISGTPTAAGTSNFTVKLTDSAGGSDSQALSLVVNPDPPTITTTSLSAGTVGTAYSQTLAATGGSTPYTWSVASGTLPAGLSLSAAGTISGTPTTAGSSSFTVKVTDSGSHSATAALSITINAPALKVTTSSLPSGTVGTPYSQTLQASGGVPAYSWSIASGSLPAGLTLLPAGTITGTPTAAGSSSFTVKVTDGTSGTATAALTLTIDPVALSVTTSTLPAGTVGSAYSQALAASGGTTPYTWSVASGTLPAGLNLSSAGTIAGTPTAAGSSNFTVKVTDSGSRTATAALSVTINPDSPSITTSSLAAGTVGTAYSQALAASGGTTPYTWSVASGTLPAGLSLSAAGTIAGTPTTAGSSSFTVKVTDNAAKTDTAALSLTINAAALKVTSSSLAGGTVGTAYSQALGASGGTPPYSWSIASGSLPAGLSLSGGTISGTPTTAGTSSFTVKVTDSASGSATAALSVAISPAALVVTTSSLPGGTVGTAYSQALGASGGTSPYSWSIASGSLPAGLTLSGGTISGTPTTAGTSSFTVKVTDSASGSATAALSLTISPAALGITTSSLPGGTVGTAYSQALGASGGTSPYSWSVASGSLPAGLSLSAGGTISGTPTTAGSSSFTVKVTDSGSVSATAALSLSISAASLSITTSTLPAGTVATAYAQALNGSGGTSIYSWSVSSGSLPAGLSLSSGGIISGTPTTAGTSSFTVKLTDTASGSTTASLSLTINPAALTITTTSLPSGGVGTAYSQALGASGGTAPYSWSIASGSLPAGLSLSGGTISGTPGTAGTSSFTVKVTDSASGSATAALSLTINPPGLGVTTSALPAATVGTAYSQALTASGGTSPYSWSVASGSLPAGLSLSAGGIISGTPTSAGASTFTAKVTDGASGSATASLSLTVNPPALGITTSSLPSGAVGTAYSQTVGASGGSPPYAWSIASGSLPSGLSLSATGVISGTPDTAGSSNITLKVTDNASVSATAALSLTINPAGLGITTSALPAGTVGAAYSQALAASGGTPPYSWSVASGSLPAGLSLSAGGIVSGMPGAAGSSSFTVKVIDSASVTATAALSLNVNPPVLGVTTSSLPTGTVGTAYSQALAASGGTAPYAWTVASGTLPSGLSLSAGGTISGTPTAAGSSSFTVKVTDGASASATAALSLAVNSPGLEITTSSLPAGTVGAAYSQALAASGGSPPYSWSLNSGILPSGLNLSAAGTISGTPTSRGTTTFSVQVTDSVGTKATNTLSIQIQAAPIQIMTSSLPASTVGATYTQPLVVNGGTGPFVWSVSSGSLPPGLTLDSGGAIRGSPKNAGSYTFTIQATDNLGVSASMSYAVTINGGVAVETESLADALIGAPYTQPLKASGGTPPYTWSITSGLLPDGVKLDSTAGTLAGTPTSVNTFKFTLRVVDSVGAFAERQFQITTAAGLIITTAPTLAPASAGLPYAQQLDAAGGRSPYIWSISSGGLPAGLTLNTSTGALSGVPSVAGSFQFTVDVSDSQARKASKQFSLTVAAPLTISSAPQLPPATAGIAYTQVLTATGGTPPYLWSITAGGLPAGLSFDAATATISGTPTLGGDFTFTVQVMDNNSVSATKQFTLAVTSNLTITTATPLPDAIAGTPYAATLIATGGLAPYVWTVAAGSLPAGLALDPASNSIAGTPSANGTFAFTLQVTDAGGGSASRDYTLTVGLPPLPSVSMDGLPDPANAADQPFFTVSLATAYPVQLTGQIVMTFTPDAVVAIDDTSVQFASGGRTVNFTIPAGSTTAVFSSPRMALQTGTVSGAIALNLTLQSAGGEVTATSVRTLHVLRGAPVTRTVSLVHTATGFELHITGYATPRQLTQAQVQITPSAGSNLQTTQLTIPLTDLAGTWYQSAASSRFGSQFTLVLPFTIQGSASVISSVGVSLANDQGSSTMVTSQF